MASGYNLLAGEGNDVVQRSYGTTDLASGTQSETEFFQLCSKITTQIFKISNATSTLQRSLKQVGGAADNQVLRERISQICSTAGASVEETTGMLHTLLPLVQGDRYRRLRTDRLHKDLQAATSRFVEVQKDVTCTLRTAQLPADMVAVEQDEASSTTDIMITTEEQSQAKMKELRDMEFEKAKQLEQKQQVEKLESDISDINQMMKDLSAVVTAQGEVVDTIEDNVKTTAGQVEEGRGELAKAAQFQKKSRKKLCACILVLLIVLFILGLIIGIHFSQKK